MSRAITWTSRRGFAWVVGLGVIGCLALVGIAAAAESPVSIVRPEAEGFRVSGTAAERVWCVTQGDYVEWMWTGQEVDENRIERAAINITAWTSDRVLGDAGADVDVLISIRCLGGSVVESGVLHLVNTFEPQGAAALEVERSAYVARGAYVLRNPGVISRGFRVRLEPVTPTTGSESMTGTRSSAGVFAAESGDAGLAYRVSESVGGLAEILADPQAYEGRSVRLDGAFYGAVTELVDGVPPECTFGGCDFWVFGVDGWYVYVIGSLPAGLDAAVPGDLGASVTIEGTVRVQLSRAACPYAYVDLVSAIPGEAAFDLRIVGIGTADGQEVVLPSGATLAIDLPSNPTTGYRWEVESLEPEGVASIAGNGSGFDVPDPADRDRVGVGGIQRFVVLGEGVGDAVLQLVYRHASGDAASDGFQLTIHVVAPSVLIRPDES